MTASTATPPPSAEAVVQPAPVGERLSGRLVAGNVGWNLLGQVLPVVVAVACIPVLTRSLGTDSFGLLALAWTFVGYFSIFDLGIGQAMTRSVAAKIASHEESALAETMWTALAAMSVLGIVGFVAAWFAGPLLIHALRTPPSLQGEARTTVQLLAVSIPLVITSTGLRGILEAHLSFRLVNAVRIPLGFWTYLGPIVALPFSHSLVVIVGVLILGRVAGFAVYLAFCLATVPQLRHVVTDSRLVRPLLAFGGWLTLDNVVDPLTSFVDRFLIGSLVSLSAVAYYSVPYELAAKAWLVPVALSGVLFPAFTRAHAVDPEHARQFFIRGLKFLSFAMFPIALVMVCCAQGGLRLWIGANFAVQSAPVLMLLAVGILVTSLGSVADTYMQSTGHPDISARLAVAKLIVHFAPAFWVVSNFGIVGLAALWVGTTGLEAAGMFYCALRLQHAGWSTLAPGLRWFVPMSALLAVGALPLPILAKALYALVVLAALTPLAWRRFMTASERDLVLERVPFRAWAPSGQRP